MNTGFAVAVVGLGYFSQFHLESWQSIAETRICGVTDLDPERRRAVAQSFGTRAFADLEEMIEQAGADILDIVTPPPTHASFIRSALGSVKTVICQKPFCTSLQEARTIVEEAAAAQTRIVIHENFRFQPWHREIKHLIETDRIGNIYQATFRLRPGDGQGPDAYLTRQPFFREMPRFLVHETGVHFIDLFRWMFGEIAAVYSDLRRLNPAIVGEDAGLLVMEHQSGIRSVFDGNRLSDHVARDKRRTMGELVVEGEQGTIRLDGEGRIYVRDFGAGEEELQAMEQSQSGFGGGCVEALNRHVIAHLAEGAAIENEAGAYLPVIAVDEAAYRSNSLGARITIGEDRNE